MPAFTDLLPLHPMPADLEVIGRVDIHQRLQLMHELAVIREWLKEVMTVFQVTELWNSSSGAWRTYKNIDDMVQLFKKPPYKYSFHTEAAGNNCIVLATGRGVNVVYDWSGTVQGKTQQMQGYVAKLKKDWGYQ